MKRHRKQPDSESVQPKATVKPSRTDKIARMLSDLADLMRQEDVGKEAIHHLRQLQMRFRFSKEQSPKREKLLRLEKPPARWVDRKNKSESPVDFIKREYKPWLGRGLTRAHLRVDPALYDALSHYLRDNEPPSDFDLPTKSEMIDRQLEAGESLSIRHTDEQKEKRRLRESVRRRSKRDRLSYSSEHPMKRPG